MYRGGGDAKSFFFLQMTQIMYDLCVEGKAALNFETFRLRELAAECKDYCGKALK